MWSQFRKTPLALVGVGGARLLKQCMYFRKKTLTKAMRLTPDCTCCSNHRHISTLAYDLNPCSSVAVGHSCFSLHPAIICSPLWADGGLACSTHLHRSRTLSGGMYKVQAVRRKGGLQARICIGQLTLHAPLRRWHQRSLRTRNEDGHALHICANEMSVSMGTQRTHTLVCECV